MPFPSSILAFAGQSITGSYNRLQVMASGSVVTVGGSAFAVGHIKALKDGNGNSFTFSSSSAIFLPPGTVMDLMITSASLDASSAPIMFFTI
jgi:hypothetical protein